MIDWILGVLGKVLAFFNSITGNYLLAVLLFALLFKIVLFPLSIKQQKNQLKQAKLQPKIKAIQKKYKGRDDQVTKQKIQQETQELYSAEGFNPLGGCLPLLLQFPIILAIYAVIRNPLQYICGVSKDVINVLKDTIGGLQLSENASKLNGLDIFRIVRDNFTTIQNGIGEYANEVDVSSFTSLDASKLPDFSLFGTKFDLSVIPSFDFSDGKWIYLLIPILTFASVFLTSYLTRKLSYVQADEMQQNGCSKWIMDLMMPAMSTYFTFVFPALLGIYWIFNNILSLLQTLLLRKMYPAPVFTEQDYKNAEREIRGKTVFTGTMSPEDDPRVIPGKKYKSLHHIDDDDDIPELPSDDSNDDDSDEDNDSEE
ncbi:MAG: membrane protein insertase YidC [Clostridia bacterium]|nr:membrane protein insertase YidC [Clostridia bacterium]